MRPYLAIIKDSFRAALASRVLYVLLAIITILLMLLAPIHYREVMDWEVRMNQHVPNPQRLVTELVDHKDDDSRPDLMRIWERLPDDLKPDLIRVANEQLDDEDVIEDSAENDGQGSGRRQPDELANLRTFGDLIEGLNEIIKQPDFYDEKVFESRLLGTEITDLVESDNRSEERSRRLNRLLLGSSLPGAILSGAPTALDIYYLIWKVDVLSSNTTHAQFSNWFSGTIRYLFDKFVMSLGLLIAILVTANIIPETFDPGSLNLLLSKPISRWGLLVSKFIGGCAFVALCSAYLLFGTWLWLGFGLGLWDRAILFGIPLYVVVFAIYYSVSVLVGVWYRSAILSVILTGIFWGICFLVGTGYGRLDTRMENGEITTLIPVEENLLHVDPVNRVFGWNKTSNEWTSKLKADMATEQEVSIEFAMFIAPMDGEMPPGLGPVFDSSSQLLWSGIINFADPRSFNQQNCHVASPETMEFKKLGKFPYDSTGIFATENGPVVVTGEGSFFQFNGEQLELAKATATESGAEEGAGDEADDPGEDANRSSDEGDSDEGDTDEGDTDENEEEKEVELFLPVGPNDPTRVRRATYVDFNQKRQEFAIYDRTELNLFKGSEDGDYFRYASTKIETGVDTSMSCMVKYQGDHIIVALGNGQIILVDAETLAEKMTYTPETRSAIKQISSSKDGRYFTFAYRNENLWLLDLQNEQEIKKLPISGQGSISSASFDSKGRLWVGDRTDRASRYDMESFTADEVYSPKGTWFANAYRYALGPIYRICPKPGEFYKLIDHLSSTGDSKYNLEVDLRRTSESKNPWAPLTSGLYFMMAMLILACLAFQFTDY